MTTGLLNSAGTDFDSLFQTGTGTQLFYIYTNAGVDAGQRYLPASMGEAGASCGFKNSAGSDIGPLLCKTGTNWTHAVTVGEHHPKSGRVIYGYSSSWGIGSIVIKSGAFAATNFIADYDHDTYGTYIYNHIQYWNSSSSSYTTVNAPPSTIYRLDNGVSYSAPGISSEDQMMFTSADVGKTIYFRVVYNG